MDLRHKKVALSILSSNAYIGNRKVLNISEIATVVFSEQNLKTIKDILGRGEYERLATLTPPKDLLSAELTVISFNNETGKMFYGIYYDSIELFQNPEIVEIFLAR